LELNMNKPLSQKIALITGASRGIGAAIARRLAQEGAELLLHYGSGAAETEALAAELRTADTKVTTLQADLASPSGGQQLVARLTALGVKRIDVLVNNAGAAPFVSTADTDADTFERMLNVNIRSLFFVTQGVLPHMPEGGRIINISYVVTRIAFPGIPAYAASKGFVDVLTLQQAAEFGPRGITVNAVAPGVIDTRMSAWIHGEGGKETLAQIQALPGIGQPEQVAGVVAFLAGPDGAWTTGQVVDVSGGTKHLALARRAKSMRALGMLLTRQTPKEAHALRQRTDHTRRVAHAEGRDRQGHHRLTRTRPWQEAGAHAHRYPGDSRRGLGLWRLAHRRLEGGAARLSARRRSATPPD
jgi:3-oxoacyl-[acyl-carrier protein] reductase